MRKLFLVLAALFALVSPALAQDRSPKVVARLVAEDLAVAPGGKISVALEEKIRAGWHTYWINAGDVGTPTMIQWTLPPGWQAGPIQWPAPKRLPVAGFMDYGYEDLVWLISELTAPANAKVGDIVTIKAAASWLVCQQTCVPEDRELSLTVKVGPTATDPSVAKDFAAARAKLPVASPWKLTYAARDGHIDLYAAAPQLAAAHPRDAAFFPLAQGVILNPAPQEMGFAKDGLVLRLRPGAKAASLKGSLQGVLVLTSSDGSVQALAVDAPAGAVPTADFPAGQEGMSVMLAILLAFLGGLILNVMPCVLPILAMKALAVAGHSARARHEARLEGLSYAGGAVLSFLVFGLTIVILRAGGAAIGWGFQLQAPLAVAGFTLLMFAVGLNLSGLFEIGTISAGGGLAAKGGAGGAFFTGVLAVAVAAPCTGPFMATALGFALTQSGPSAMAIFAGLGLGFALPFLILGFWPRALSFLPKPGPWMLRLKQFLAFPMYGAAVFFAGVLAQETGATGVMVLLGAALAVALAGWVWSVTRDLPARGRTMGLVAVLLVLAAGAFGLSLLPGSPPPSAATPSTAGAEHFTPEKLASLRAANKPVFIDATAAWCITCLVNEQAVLSRPNVKAAFAARNVAYLVADWTNNDPAVTKLLNDNGRSGVPLYLYYVPGAAEPVILPQILTEGEVLNAIGG
jgi:thiol:disulfide interchange protein DsbD